MRVFVSRTAGNFLTTTEKDTSYQRLQHFPAREKLSEKERIATAAVNLIHAIRKLPPTYCPHGRLKFFVILNNTRYLRVLQAVAFLHSIVVTMYEPPPRLYGEPDQIVNNAGYSVKTTMFVDLAICSIFLAHVFLSFLAESPEIQSGPSRVDKPLTAIVLLLFIDMVINMSRDSHHYRPFRFLRPCVFVLLTESTRGLARSIAATLAPLTKTFVILICAHIFYAMFGLNLFSGQVTSANPFGAACLGEGGESHPFSHFAQSFVTMYVLATGATYPSVIWPFYACSCNFHSLEPSVPSFATGELKWCSARKLVSLLFFGSFMLLVFFSLGNCILAVTYHFFDAVSRRNVLQALVHQRLSVVACFFYLENENHQVDRATYDRCMTSLTQMWPCDKGKIVAAFNYLDENKNGTIDLREMFMLPDILLTEIKCHKGRPSRVSTYQRWKDSWLRNKLMAHLSPRFGALSDVDLISLTATLGFGVLRCIDRTRRLDFVASLSDFLVLFFAVEVVVKVVGIGVHSFWLKVRHKFDLALLVCCGSGYFYRSTITESPAVGQVTYMFQSLILLRLLHLTSFFAAPPLQDMNKPSKGEQQEERDEKTKKKKKRLAKRRAKWKKKRALYDEYYKKLVASLTMTFPLCANVIALLFLFMSSFALLNMEILSTSDTNSKVSSVRDGTIDYSGGDPLRYDWSDFLSSLWTVATIIAQNGWDGVMANAMDATHFNIAWFFLAFHFLSTFLILNVIQSLFVFAFATMLDEQEFIETHEYFVRDQVSKLATSEAVSVKQIRTPSRLEYLTVANREVEQNFKMFRKSNRHIGVGQSDFSWVDIMRTRERKLEGDDVESTTDDSDESNDDNNNNVAQESAPPGQEGASKDFRFFSAKFHMNRFAQWNRHRRTQQPELNHARTNSKEDLLASDNREEELRENELVERQHQPSSRERLNSKNELDKLQQDIFNKIQQHRSAENSSPMASTTTVGESLANSPPPQRILPSFDRTTENQILRPNPAHLREHVEQDEDSEEHKQQQSGEREENPVDFEWS